MSSTENLASMLNIKHLFATHIYTIFILVLTGSPFQFHVDAINSGFVTAYGPGLSHGVANEPAEFTIVTKDAGAGRLVLSF